MTSRLRISILLWLVLAFGGCAQPSVPPSMSELVFLTRDGCVNASTMRANLDEALRSLQLPADYQVIDVDTFAGLDARGSYGTPTVLYRNYDVFGMPIQAVPYRAATCRLYPDGVPSSAAIRDKLRRVVRAASLN